MSKIPTDISKMPANTNSCKLNHHIQEIILSHNRGMEPASRQQSAAFTHILKKQLRQQQGEPDPPKYFTTGSNSGNTLHARLRMDIAQLYSHLHVIQKVPSPQCECRYWNENVNHFTLHCPKYDSQSEEHFDSISRTLKFDFSKIHT